MSEETTIGKKLVGLNFNPSGNDEVDAIKKVFADVVDLLLRKQMSADGPIVGQLCSEAIGHALTAQMWAVKVVTFKE